MPSISKGETEKNWDYTYYLILVICTSPCFDDDDYEFDDKMRINKEVCRYLVSFVRLTLLVLIN